MTLWGEVPCGKGIRVTRGQKSFSGEQGCQEEYLWIGDLFWDFVLGLNDTWWEDSRILSALITEVSTLELYACVTFPSSHGGLRLESENRSHCTKAAKRETN